MLEKEKEQVVEYCQKMAKDGLVKGTGGNISVFNRGSGCFAISPSGIEYDVLLPEDIVVMNLKGEVVEGKRRPSTEHELHRVFYANREDLDAVIHVHSTYLTVLGTLREGLPASNYLVALGGPDIPCAEYASFGTKELAENAFEAMKERQAVILANHGAVAGAKSLKEAYNIISELEQCAKVYIIARSVGTPVILDEEEMERMQYRFRQDYGQKKDE